LRDGEFWLEDLNSNNGTRLNGAPVAKVKLVSNDTIELGDTQLRFIVEEPDGALEEVAGQRHPSP
jgi:pSer/pThr/pTyr-binding forkhead associated (FHA) protein